MLRQLIHFSLSFVPSVDTGSPKSGTIGEFLEYVEVAPQVGVPRYSVIPQSFYRRRYNLAVITRIRLKLGIDFSNVGSISPLRWAGAILP